VPTDSLRRPAKTLTVAARDTDDPASLVARAQNDPVWLAQAILNHRQLPGEPALADAPEKSWEMDRWQVRLLEAFADVYRKKNGLPTVENHQGLPWLSVVAMHGPGKTHTAALIAHVFNFCFPGRIVVTAPKFTQLTTRFMPAFRKIMHRAQPWYRKLLSDGERKVTWCNDKDWCLLLETASKPENLAGHHERFLLVIVEEATGVTESLWPVVFGALSSGEIVILLMISNPTKRNGTFAKSHLSATESLDYYRMRITLDQTMRVRPEWAQRMARKYGENSPIYRIRVLGEFASDDAFQLIATEWVTAAAHREFVGDGSLPKLRVSVDVSDGGEDETVVTVARHYSSHTVVLKQKAFSFELAKAQIDAADAAERMFDEYGGRKGQDDFVVDSLGVGTGCAGELYDRGHVVIRYKGGEASDNDKKWRNRRTQSYLVARDAFRDGLISFADDAIDEYEELEAQLCSVKRKVVGDDKVEDLVTREEMRREGIKSPDRADSIVMQFATQAPVYSPGSHGKEPQLLATTSTLLDGLAV
jgi:phage terminase large subunit